MTDEWPSLEDLANLSNSIGTTSAELTIEDMQRAMKEVGERQRQYAEEAQAKADEAYLRLRMEPLGPIEARYALTGLVTDMRLRGLGPGATPTVEVDATSLRWVRNREPQRAARRIRMARKRRRGWA